MREDEGPLERRARHPMDMETRRRMLAELAQEEPLRTVRDDNVDATQWRDAHERETESDAPWCHVIAFNRREYLQWCFEHDYDFQRPDWIYAPDPQWLRKHTQHAEPGYRYMLTARARQRRDWEQMQYRLDEDAALRVNPDGSWHIAEPLEETWVQFTDRIAADPACPDTSAD